MIRLTIERKRRGWSQMELARRSGVHVTSISLIENRRFVPGVTQIEKIRKALRVRRENAQRLLEVLPEEPLPTETKARAS